MRGGPHGLPGTGCDREGVPLDEGRSLGDAAQHESGGHIERISLHCIPQFDPPDAVAETHERYGSAEALHAGGGATGLGEDQGDLVGKRRGHHDGVHEKAKDDPGDAGSMCLTQREVRERSAIERFFSWIGEFKEIVPGYERCEHSFMGLIHLACSVIVTRVLG